jgi:hypothetical protein
MPTIAERNDIAFASMRERFQERLDTETVQMTLGELVEYTEACDSMCDLCHIESYAQLTCFLMQNLGYDYPDAPVVLRYKTLNTSEGIQSALSDWDNRYEMGK